LRTIDKRSKCERGKGHRKRCRNNAGNTALVNGVFRNRSLQWGPDLIIGESRTWTPTRWPPYSLQWGPDLVIGESSREIADVANWMSLQWGPDLVIGESDLDADLYALNVGFNGAPIW
jgi:hypothetical protein